MKYLLLLVFNFFLFCSKEVSNKRISPEIISKVKDHIVYIQSPKIDRPNGTGIILDKKGRVLTCYHVISAIDDSIEILLSDLKTKHNANVLYKEEIFDLLVLETDYKNNLPELEWSTLDENPISSPLFMFGSPYGLSGTYLEGYLSGKNRTKVSLQFSEIPFIQTQGLSFPGNSGGAVFNEQGKIIGINQSTYGYSTGTGIGLVIPTGFVITFLKKNSLY
jgi:serine protease Do